jgi:hypothetical protein
MEWLGVFVLVLSVVNLLLLFFITGKNVKRFNFLNNRRQDDIADLNEKVEILQVKSDRFQNWMMWKSGPHTIEDYYQMLRDLDASVQEVKGKAMLESAVSLLKAINDHNERRK